MSPRRLIMLIAVAASLSVATVSQGLKRCSTTGNYTDGSQYEQNLESLVSTLSTTVAANGKDGRWFQSGSVGTAPDQAWGLTMCYADRTATQCRACLRNASLGWLSEVCPGGHSRSLSVTYDDDGCLVRYADAPFFGAADTRYWRFAWATAYINNATDAARINETRWRLLSDLAGRAGDDDGDRRMMMSGGARYTDARGEEQALYGFVQCTTDLEASECTRCLVLALTLLSGHKDLNSSLAGSVKGFSCYVRYQLNDPIPLPSKPAGPPLGSEDGDTGKKNGLEVLVLFACVAAIVLMFVAGVKILNKAAESAGF